MTGRPVSRRCLLQNMTMGSLVVGAGLAATAPWGGLAWAEGAAHWTYEGEEGPAHWGRLAPEYGVCASGQRQSPIDLAGAGLQPGPELVLHWQPFDATIENNGHTLQVTAKDGAPENYLTLGGKKYAFQQFHFHHPSEHAVAGGRWPLEIHMVHKGEAGDLAVTGILFRPGRENEALATVLARAPQSRAKVDATRAIDMNDFLPVTAATYHYAGSLTTPPCSEIVSWTVFRDVIEAGIGQIESFARIFSMNARPLQPSFQRGIALDLF